MRDNIKLITYIGIILISILIIVLILLNTVFYNLDSHLNNYLDTYYTSDDKSIDNINNLINRYKNNTNKTIKINDIIDSDILKRIDNFNIAYENGETLLYKRDYISNKINNLLLNINLDVANKKDEYIESINTIYESKNNYLIALDYYNNNDYNNAYEYFNKVVKLDSYYNDTTNKIDIMFENSINEIEEEVNKLNIIDDNTLLDDKLKVNISILNYLNNKKSETIFDITKSKKYNELLNNNLDNIKNNYVDICISLASENKYNEALKRVDEGITLLSKNEYNSKELIDLKDEYNKMMPISLLDLEGVKEGSAINEELVVFDKDGNSYSKVLQVNNVNKSNITYNLNKEYKYLSFKSAITKEVSEKKKNYGKVKILCDNKNIYDSKDLTVSFKSSDVKLNIDSCNLLKIEYTTSSSKSISKNDISVFIIGNPTLEKF